MKTEMKEFRLGQKGTDPFPMGHTVEFIPSLPRNNTSIVDNSLLRSIKV